MSEITFQQALKLAEIEHPERHSLDANCELINRRSSVRNFLGWVVYLMTLGLVARNGTLDAVTLKIVKVARQALQEETFVLERKELAIKALRNLRTILACNSGSRIKEINQLISQVQQKKPAANQVKAPECLEAEVEKLKKHDRVLRSPHTGEWRAGLGQRERRQTLQAYQKHECPQALKDRRILRIHQVGQFSSAEVKAVRIVADYLAAVHGVAVELEPQAISIESLRKKHIERLLQQPHREDPVARRQKLEAEFGIPRQKPGEDRQYPINDMLTMAIAQLHRGDKRSSILCFTNEDLYATDMNFVFGAANDGGPGGVFSLHRLGNSSEDFKTFLKRLMKIASHEFAHMRGIDHCTDHACNIQGANHLPEMDRSPLYFCAQDMAKIAHCNGQTLKESYKRHLEFLENFSQKTGVQLDLSEEIANLRARVRALRP